MSEAKLMHDEEDGTSGTVKTTEDTTTGVSSSPPLGIAVLTFMKRSSATEGINSSYRNLPRISPELLSTLYHGFRQCKCTPEDGSVPAQPAELSHMPAETWFDFVSDLQHVHGRLLAEPILKGLFITLLFTVLLVGSSVCVIHIVSPWLFLPLLCAGLLVHSILFEPVHMVATSPLICGGGGLAHFDAGMGQLITEWQSQFAEYGYDVYYEGPTVATYGWLDQQMRVVEFVQRSGNGGMQNAVVA